MLLQVIWFALVGVLLAGYAVLDGFDLGVGALYPFLGKTEAEKAVMRNSIGPVWDGNEVWLLTGGGALFAAFPPVYATVFSGFYLALMLVLFSLIFRAVSLEFRAHDEGWAGLWDWAFFLGSALPSLLFGVAVGNIVLGVPLRADGEFAGNFFTLLGFWAGGFNPLPLTIGVLGLSMILLQGASWVALKAEGDLRKRASALRSTLAWTFTGLAVLATVVTALFGKTPFGNAIASPIGWLFLVLLVVSIAWGRMAANSGSDMAAWYAVSLSTVSLVGIWAATIFPNLVPSIGDAGGAATKGLAVYDTATAVGASSSQLTLTVMLIIAIIGVPLVLFYEFLVYKTFAGKTSAEGPGY
jgi:cytochrome bd ubiquinol oxidase subunit II